MFEGKREALHFFAGDGKITATAPLVIDPLFLSLGFLPVYEKYLAPQSGSSLHLSAVIIGSKFRCKLRYTHKGESICDATLFVEKIARNLSRQTGREYDELNLNREMSLFEDSLNLTRRLVNSWEKGKDHLEYFLRAIWSLPAGARVMAFQELEHFSLDSVPLRFDPNISISEEVAKTCDAHNNSGKTSLNFNIPSTCRLGEILYRYIYPLREDEIGVGDNKIP